MFYIEVNLRKTAPGNNRVMFFGVICQCYGQKIQTIDSLKYGRYIYSMLLSARQPELRCIFISNHLCFPKCINQIQFALKAITFPSTSPENLWRSNYSRIPQKEVITYLNC